MLNEKGGPVGLLLGDGTQVSIGNTAKNVKLCLKMRKELISKPQDYESKYERRKF